MTHKSDMDLALEMVRRAAARETWYPGPMITTFMGYTAEAILELRKDRDRLFLACRRLINDSMFQDHPESSQMAIDAIAGRADAEEKSVLSKKEKIPQNIETIIQVSVIAQEERNRAINWLNDAIRYFQGEQDRATTRWIAEQHQEREKACKYALDRICQIGR